MIKVAAPPADRLNGQQLARELEAAGYRNVQVIQVNTDLGIDGTTEAGSDIDERSRPKVEAVVNAHIYTPTEQRLADLEATVKTLVAFKAEVEKHPAFKALR